MNDEHETGYASRIATVLTVRNVVLFLFGVVVGCACYYGAAHYG